MWRSAFFNGKWPLWVFLDATGPCRRDSSGLHKDILISFRADQVTPAPSTSIRKFIAACAPDYGQEKMVDEGVCKER